MKQTIITISREFGSGGHFIGEEVSKRLGIPFYDKNIIQQIAEKPDFPRILSKNSPNMLHLKICLPTLLWDGIIPEVLCLIRSMPPRHRLSAILPKKDPASSSDAALTIF